MLKRVINSVRRNHALEHATISILLSRHGPMRIVGRAVSDGFYIYGDVPTERLRKLADEALLRLQRGKLTWPYRLSAAPTSRSRRARGPRLYAALGAGPGAWAVSPAPSRRHARVCSLRSPRTPDPEALHHLSGPGWCPHSVCDADEQASLQGAQSAHRSRRVRG
jgi:hypothetical protein